MKYLGWVAILVIKTVCVDSVPSLPPPTFHHASHTFPSLPGPWSIALTEMVDAHPHMHIPLPPRMGHWAPYLHIGWHRLHSHLMISVFYTSKSTACIAIQACRHWTMSSQDSWYCGFLTPEAVQNFLFSGNSQYHNMHTFAGLEDEPDLAMGLIGRSK